MEKNAILSLYFWVFFVCRSPCGIDDEHDNFILWVDTNMVIPNVYGFINVLVVFHDEKHFSYQIPRPMTFFIFLLIDIYEDFFLLRVSSLYYYHFVCT